MPQEPLETSDAESAETLPTFAGRLEQRLKEIRRTGTPAEIVAAAKDADSAIQARLGAADDGLSAEQRAALLAAKRLLFNAAADCWPGWSVDSPRGSEAELLGALELARRSGQLVEQLALGAAQEGTAIWLEGAFELALGRPDAALASFGRAERRYRDVPAPAQVLLMQGYAAIASAAGAASPPEGAESLDRILAALASDDFEDGKEFQDQLRVAHRIFA